MSGITINLLPRSEPNIPRLAIASQGFWDGWEPTMTAGLMPGSLAPEEFIDRFEEDFWLLNEVNVAGVWYEQ